MGRGVSLHIGLNRVDPGHYGGWSGPLAACEFDANDMAEIAGSQHFDGTKLLTESATSAAVISRIRAAATSLIRGDIFLLTYSGHGSHVPDREGDEEDGQDETWCLFDRQLLDDELYHLFSLFEDGVRIVMVSDSCHSGTVARVAEFGSRSGGGEPAIRLMPPDVAERVWRRSRSMYEAIEQQSPARGHDTVRASVLLISGCQDHQFSYDGSRNGQFTGELRKVWDEGRFGGSYKALHSRVRAQLPPWQTPNLFQAGAPDPGFQTTPAFRLRTISSCSGESLRAAVRSDHAGLWGESLPGLSGWEPVREADQASGLARARDRSQIPQSLDDLPQAINRSYDMTLSGAAELGIPVAGSVSGGGSRRVVILERAAFTEIEADDGAVAQWGYAIRYCITVSKLEASMKLTLPFLAASAQVGSVEAQWMMHITGLSGPQIDQATMAPTELNVETFVLAKQSLERLIAAVRHETTRFHAMQIARRTPADQRLLEYKRAVGTTIAIDRISDGRDLSRALGRLSDSTVIDGVRETYDEFLGGGGAGPVTQDARARAQGLIGRVSVRY